MTANPYIDAAANMANALGALKLKRHTLVSIPEGVEIHAPGKPVLILTYESARQWALNVKEAENG